MDPGGTSQNSGPQSQSQSLTARRTSGVARVNGPRLLPNPFQAMPSAGIRTDIVGANNSTPLTDGPFVTSPLNLRQNSIGGGRQATLSRPPALLLPSIDVTSADVVTLPVNLSNVPRHNVDLPHHASTIEHTVQSTSQLVGGSRSRSHDFNVTQPQPARSDEFGIYTVPLTDPYNNAPPYNPNDGGQSFPSTRVASSTSVQGAGDYPGNSGDELDYKGYNYSPGYSKIPPSSAAPEQQAFFTPSRMPTSASGWPGTEPSYSERVARMFETKLYERPSYPSVAVHILLCIFAYPILVLTALAASGRSLFWSRFIVSIGCGIVGLSLGFSLIRFARHHLEACTWATVIHESLPTTGKFNVSQVDPSTPVPISFLPSNVTSSSHTTTLANPYMPTKRASTFPRSPNTPIAPVTPDSIHHGAPGVRLKDLSTRSSDSGSALVALQVLKARWNLWKLRRVSRLKEMEKDKKLRKVAPAGSGGNFWNGAYDEREDIAKDKYGWSGHIIFFLCLVGLSGILPFILGRFVSIETHTEHSLNAWEEVPVFGDLSEADVENARQILGAFESFVQTWSLAPFASLTSLPQAVAFHYDPLNSTVYFAEAYPSQLRTDGVALGTYNYNQTNMLSSGVRAPAPNTTSGTNTDLFGDEALNGALVQFPKWGIRIECELLPDMNKYLIPVSSEGFTHVFVPNFLLDGLFGKLSITPPVLAPANVSAVLTVNDTLPAGLDTNEIVYIFSFYANGVAHSFASRPVKQDDSSGFYEIEIHLVRINELYTPQGVFPVFGPDVPSGGRVGYDAAVCVEVYEPWIVEAFNSSSGVLPLTTRIVGRGNEMRDEWIDSMNSGSRNAKRKKRVTTAERALNSTGKAEAFAVAHDNSVNQMVKDNGRDQDYVPSPTVVSWTNGTGPNGYTKLSPIHLAGVRATADSTNVLPYLAGSKQITARRFQDRTIANARVLPWLTVVALAVIALIGLAAGFTVPRLPLGVPRRGFDLMSWLAVLHGDGMVGHVPEKQKRPGTLGEDGTPVLEQKMSLSEVEKRMGEMRVRYVL